MIAPIKSRWYLPPEPLQAGQLRFLLLLGASIALGRYDTELLSLLIPYIQKDLGVAEQTVAVLFGYAKLGVIPGLLIGLFADRIGRTRMLGFTILAFSVATAATAFARTREEFIAAQFFARAFIGAESSLVAVIAIEELASRNRGWALGFGAAFAALGSGIAAIFFAFIEQAPGGWRGLYFVGIIGILLLAYFRNGLSETRRFVRVQGAAGVQGVWQFLAPLRELLNGPFKVRVRALFAAHFFYTAGVASVFALQTKQLIEVHGFQPANVTVLFITGGALAILGNVAGGLVSDRVGRKPALAVAVVVTCVGVAGFFLASGPAMIFFWILYAFANFAAGVIFTALDGELFPTQQRATASAAANIVQTVGFLGGTMVEGHLYSAFGAHSAAAASLALLPVIGLMVAMKCLPETANRVLEDVSPDQAVDSGS